MVLNVTHFMGIHFDPYPFILLNLFLSTIAAFQAPIIMMSQNRAAAHDHIDAENDYQINKDSEHRLKRLEKRLRHQDKKINHLVTLTAIQQQTISRLTVSKRPKAAGTARGRKQRRAKMYR